MADDDNGRNYGRVEHLREMLEGVKADVREMRTLRESDQRMLALHHADAATWRAEVKTRMDTFQDTLQAIKVDLAGRKSEPQASPVTAALSAAGGGGGALLIYLIVKALGILPQ